MLEILGLKGNFSHLNLSDPFNVHKLGSSYATEIRAGLTTFLAMAYILPVNSGMLSLAVPDMKEPGTRSRPFFPFLEFRV